MGFGRARAAVEVSACHFFRYISCFDDELVLEGDDPQGHENRFMLVAQTAAGRVLQVVVSERELPLYRIITAFDAGGAWLAEYENDETV